jgi:hypothetical protein
MITSRTSPSAEFEMMEVPGCQVIALFLIFGLFPFAGWGGLDALVTVVLKLGPKMQGNAINDSPLLIGQG